MYSGPLISEDELCRVVADHGGQRINCVQSSLVLVLRGPNVYSGLGSQRTNCVH